MRRDPDGLRQRFANSLNVTLIDSRLPGGCCECSAQAALNAIASVGQSGLASEISVRENWLTGRSTRKRTCSAAASPYLPAEDDAGKSLETYSQDLRKKLRASLFHHSVAPAARCRSSREYPPMLPFASDWQTADLSHFHCLQDSMDFIIWLISQTTLVTSLTSDS